MGKDLESERKRRRVTQAALAERLGIGRDTVVRLECRLPVNAANFVNFAVWLGSHPMAYVETEKSEELRT